MKYKRDKTLLNIQLNNRKNKISKGMTKTSFMQNYNTTILPLIVHGTFDLLANNARGFWKEKTACKCCSQKIPKYKLSKNGKVLLNNKKIKLDKRRV